MRVLETDDQTLVFVLSNKDIKQIKRTRVPLGANAVKGDKQVKFAFVSDETFIKIYLPQIQAAQKRVKEREAKALEENAGKVIGDGEIKG